MISKSMKNKKKTLKPHKSVAKSSNSLKTHLKALVLVFLGVWAGLRQAQTSFGPGGDQAWTSIRPGPDIRPGPKYQPAAAAAGDDTIGSRSMIAQVP